MKLKIATWVLSALVLATSLFGAWKVLSWKLPEANLSWEAVVIVLGEMFCITAVIIAAMVIIHRVISDE